MNEIKVSENLFHLLIFILDTLPSRSRLCRFELMEEEEEEYSFIHRFSRAENGSSIQDTRVIEKCPAQSYQKFQGCAGILVLKLNKSFKHKSNIHIVVMCEDKVSPLTWVESCRHKSQNRGVTTLMFMPESLLKR